MNPIFFILHFVYFHVINTFLFVGVLMFVLGFTGIEFLGAMNTGCGMKARAGMLFLGLPAALAGSSYEIG